MAQETVPTVLDLYEKLKPRLGEEETRALLAFVEASVERKAATKEDLQRTELALREEIHRLDQKIEATEADLIKWTFGFWVGNVAVLSGIMFAIVRAFAGK